MKIKIITDSTAYLSKQDLLAYNIDQVSLSVIFDNEEHEELAITAEDVMEAFAKKQKVSSSQPSPQKFEEKLKLYLDEYDYIIVLTLPTTLSGTANSARIAVENLGTDKVKVIAVNKCAFGLENYIMAANNLIKSATDIDTLMSELNELNHSGSLYFKISNLKHLYNGGRLNISQFMLASLLKIKAVIKQDDEGKLNSDVKLRTDSKVIDYFLDKVQENYDENNVNYIRLVVLNDVELEKHILKVFKMRFKNANITLTSTMGPVLTVHLGDTGFGVSHSFYKK